MRPPCVVGYSHYYQFGLAYKISERTMSQLDRMGRRSWWQLGAGAAERANVSRTDYEAAGPGGPTQLYQAGQYQWMH